MTVSHHYARELETESPYSVVKIPCKRIPGIWHAVLPMLQVGLTAAPELDIDYIIEGLSDESIQLWVVLGEVEEDTVELQGVFLTSVERDRGEWVVSLYALGGQNPREWLDECDAKMQVFALIEGAKRVRMCGRKAWIRLLPKSFAITGMRGGHFVYERDVEPDGATRRIGA